MKYFFIVSSGKYTGTLIDYGALSGRLDARVLSAIQGERTYLPRITPGDG